MVIAAPVNLTYGTITGKFYSTVLDSADTGREPDYVPATGTVTFTPAVSSYKNLAIPALVGTTPVTGTIDALGDLRDSQGALGVYLVATNNPDLVPRDWTYTVTISITGASPITFPMLVTTGATIDLTAVAPAATSAGTALVVSSADRIAAQSAAAAAAASAAAAAQSAIDAAAAGGGGGGLTSEQVQDVFGAMASGSGYVSVTYNDAANTIVFNTTAGLTTLLNSLAPINNPVFTGSPVVPGYLTTTAAASKADLVGGVVPTSQLPPLAINDVFTVANQAAMLALTAQRGDMAIRTDLGSTFVLSADTPSVLSAWMVVAAAGGVTSVAGRTGAVALTEADIANLPTDLAALAAKALTASYRDKNETTGVWPPRDNSGYHHDIARGTNPGPVDSVAGDERSIPR